MEALFLLVSPLIVNVVTQFTKKVKMVEQTPNRVLVIRALVGLFSFLLVVANAWLTGGEVDESTVQAFVETTFGTIFVAALSQISYYYYSKATK